MKLKYIYNNKAKNRTYTTSMAMFDVLYPHVYIPEEFFLNFNSLFFRYRSSDNITITCIGSTWSPQAFIHIKLRLILPRQISVPASVKRLQREFPTRRETEPREWRVQGHLSASYSWGAHTLSVISRWT